MSHRDEYHSVIMERCVVLGLPQPVPEFYFHPTRGWHFDYAWTKHRIALEVDGGLFIGGRHAGGVGQLKDYEKRNAAAALGWRVFNCGPPKPVPKHPPKPKKRKTKIVLPFLNTPELWLDILAAYQSAAAPV